MMYVGNARALDSSFEAYDWQHWCSLTVQADDDFIGTLHGPIRVPRIVVLNTYSRVPRAAVRLSRRNIFLRDGYRCQYCAQTPKVTDLNLDHVLPRSRGGKNSWDNLVTSCRACNLYKGRYTPQEIGMRLLREPVRPTWTAAAQLGAAPRRFAEWEPFLSGVTLQEALPEAS
ncbi:MAG: HNH endonuclease [Sandaracinaceae bacterium]|nr:HNH endonuclease [Sandaracinaceae bacterium]